jgi:dihydroneopterin aldolase
MSAEAADVTIRVRALRVMARIGITEAELEVERPLCIDIAIDSAANRATETDEIADTIDYAAVSDLAAGVARSEPHRTLERLAAKIADGVLAEFGASGVEVAVEKPDPPMPETVAGVSVTLRAERREDAG